MATDTELRKLCTPFHSTTNLQRLIKVFSNVFVIFCNVLKKYILPFFVKKSRYLYYKQDMEASTYRYYMYVRSNFCFRTIQHTYICMYIVTTLQSKIHKLFRQSVKSFESSPKMNSIRLGFKPRTSWSRFTIVTQELAPGQFFSRYMAHIHGIHQTRIEYISSHPSSALTLFENSFVSL